MRRYLIYRPILQAKTQVKSGPGLESLLQAIWSIPGAGSLMITPEKGEG